uniref:N-(5'-phosphoribosyl)anthranilate isomerase n=1 Tax=Thermorudis peleae TaxID=1382356 RepID=A0A831TCF5_9BACT
MPVRPGIVKLCGMRTPEDALAAAAAGADLIGLVFAPSRRQVSLSLACAIVQELETLPARPAVVGLFVNAPAAEVLRLAETVPLDLIQLCGDEPAAYLDSLDRPVLRTLRLRPDITSREARALATTYFERSRPPRALVVDAHVPGQFGGTGTLADWELAAELATEFPVVLAGGLHPGNVAQAIARVRPAGVDVSSGIETQGRKDPARMRAFVVRARAAFAALDEEARDLSLEPQPTVVWKEEL